MGDIKSAFEIAMEKLKDIEEVTEDEKARWKYLPAGEKLATAYLKETVNLKTELEQYQGKAREYVGKGIENLLLSLIALPENEAATRIGSKAMEGIKSIKEDQAAAETVISQMVQIIAHYTDQGEKQRRSAYDQLKQQYSQYLQKAIQQGMEMPPGLSSDIEKHPRFQEEWRKRKNEFEARYIESLAQMKQELSQIK
ncbi:hypothetical protein CY91_07025 [Dehalococcoides mccartyi]|jgi:hypothetical protein|nr:hypothetical protein [Dehalococcoides mccartyi]AGG07832.1 hypothetical protein btf_742 [Dehalococcoides mccartyi BTF08]AQW62387.1 hypothetical protein B1779_03675 [Dehalococcoides mccartyi]AQX74587.1 hypothetical protein B1776_03280 [Dehalococcoides mccartyi]AQY73165.1 hypothetical protein B1772_03590 [Dehalococcoides mccartyi]KSV17032.1 hypothetical protein CY91_07025 [Dehalococcoides mccartyi]